MKNILFVTSMFILLVINAENCLCNEIDLGKMLIDKRSLSSLDWRKVMGAKEFKSAPIKFEQEGTSSVSRYRYGNFSFVDNNFNLSVVKDKSSEISSINLTNANDSFLDSNYQYKLVVDSITNSLNELYGKPLVRNITKFKADTVEYYTVIERSQWTFDKTRINLIIAKFTQDDGEKHISVNIVFSPTIKSKALLPTTFLNCKQQLSSADVMPVERDFVIGIDYELKRIVNSDYLELELKLEDKFITLNKTGEDVVTNMKISRATGMITGEVTGKGKFKDTNLTLSGKCEMMPDKNLF